MLEVIVKVELSAVCGSDLHIYHGRETGLDAGTVMGHEFLGTVVEAGAAVARFREGARVVAPFTTSCGACFYCKQGLTCRCERGQLRHIRRLADVDKIAGCQGVAIPGDGYHLERRGLFTLGRQHLGHPSQPIGHDPRAQRVGVIPRGVFQRGFQNLNWRVANDVLVDQFRQQIAAFLVQQVQGNRMTQHARSVQDLRGCHLPRFQFGAPARFAQAFDEFLHQT